MNSPTQKTICKNWQRPNKTVLSNVVQKFYKLSSITFAEWNGLCIMHTVHLEKVFGQWSGPKHMVGSVKFLILLNWIKENCHGILSSLFWVWHNGWWAYVCRVLIKSTECFESVLTFRYRLCMPIIYLCWVTDNFKVITQYRFCWYNT